MVKFQLLPRKSEMSQTRRLLNYFGKALEEPSAGEVPPKHSVSFGGLILEVDPVFHTGNLVPRHSCDVRSNKGLTLLQGHLSSFHA